MNEIENHNSFFNTIKYKIQIPSLLTTVRLNLDKIKRWIRELEDIQKELNTLTK